MKSVCKEVVEILKLIPFMAKHDHLRSYVTNWSYMDFLHILVIHWLIVYVWNSHFVHYREVVLSMEVLVSISWYYGKFYSCKYAFSVILFAS